MGMFQDHAYYDLDDKTRIEAEARSTIINIEYALIINGIKQDQITGFIGHYLLRGVIKSTEGDTLIYVHVHQGMFGAKYFLETGGKKIPMIQDK